ncbi:MAG: hypothetical protein U5R31_01710 [Acidimicrobiia bacterium]|nr:hypothetical protein [Acidimicrobiia bacterium]
MKKGYRLRFSPLARWSRVALFVLCGAVLLSGILYAGEALIWQLLGGVGVVASVLAIRAVLGNVVVVTPEALVIQRTWPARRRIKWYRIDHAEVIPGYWTILVELNSGERFELPCVEHIDDLYHAMEHYRTALDSA